MKLTRRQLRRMILSEVRTLNESSWKRVVMGTDPDPRTEDGFAATVKIPPRKMIPLSKHPAWKDILKTNVEVAEPEWWILIGKPGEFKVEFRDSEGVYRTLVPNSKGLIDPLDDDESYDIDDMSLHWEDAVIVNLTKKRIVVKASGEVSGP